ncbi:MAG: PAS domain S-box protein [Candidatus Aminicenantes bacterium]|nr:PAS domain S-box protein [Candidatus Aminicenantes bacterium]
MKEQNRTKAQLIKELTELRSKINELEKSKTKAKQFDNVNQEPEEKLKNIFESVSDGLIYLDRTGKILDVNKKAVQIYGGQKKELLGKHFTKLGLFSYKDVSFLLRKLTNALKGKATGLELTFKNKKGKKIILEFSTTFSKKDNCILGLIVIVRDITERKITEKALRESEEKYREMIELAPDGIMISNLKGVITSCNTALSKQTGYPLDRFINRHFTKIPTVRAIDIPKYLKVLNSLIRGKPPRAFEYKWVHKNGTTRTDELHISIRKKEGKLIGFQIITRDITNRKRAEEALKESEKRFRELWNNAPVAYHILNTKGIITSVNKTEAKMLGYKSEEMTGKSIFEFILPEQRADARRRFQQKISGKYVPRTDNRIYVKKDGSQIYVEIDDVLERNSKGKFIGIRTTMVDITELKRAEEKLREGRDYLEKLTNSMWDAVFSVKMPERVIEWANDSFRLIGYSPEECIGKTTEFLYPDKREFVDFGIKLKNAISAGKDIMHAEQLLKRKTGETFPAEITTTLFKDKGKVVNVTSIIRDISERKQAEEEIKNSREELRNLAAHLQSAREEERTLIAREIHDELGQALTALKMDLSLLTSKLPKYQKPLLSRTKSMTSLLDETIQTVKRLYTELRPSMLDDLGLAAAIEWQTEEFQSRTGIKCEVKIEPKEPILDKESSTAIFRIFQEALTNVARHTDASEVKVNLTEKAKTLELRVRDNGKGIAGEKIHDPQSYGLIGIRERAQFLGGEAKIIGVQNRGTTIAVSIPLHKNGGIQ